MADGEIFLSFEGVKGEVTLPGTSVRAGPGDGWSLLLACRLNAEANVQARALSKGGSSRVDFGGEAPPIEITKVTDGATIGLMREMLLGKTPRQAVIAFARTDAGGRTEYLRYELDGCHIVGFDFEGSDADRAAERFLLHYVKMTLIAYAGGHGAKGAQASAVLMNGG